MSPLLTRRNMERFKGPNDVIVAASGDICMDPVSDTADDQTSQTKARPECLTRQAAYTG